MPAKGKDPVWCLVMFDLPVKTKKQRSEASRFRNELLDLGFCMTQFSVYVQYLPMANRIGVIVKNLKLKLPEGGDIGIFCLTDRQWANAYRFSSRNAISCEDRPQQLTLF